VGGARSNSAVNRKMFDPEFFALLGVALVYTQPPSTDLSTLRCRDGHRSVANPVAKESRRNPLVFIGPSHRDVGYDSIDTRHLAARIKVTRCAFPVNLTYFALIRSRALTTS
jgi:hypothetical protein